MNRMFGCVRGKDSAATAVGGRQGIPNIVNSKEKVKWFKGGIPSLISRDLILSIRLAGHANPLAHAFEVLIGY